jgi:hypothetical protein
VPADSDFVVIPAPTAAQAAPTERRIPATWTINGVAFRPMEFLPFKVKDWNVATSRGFDVIATAQGGTNGMTLDKMSNLVMVLIDKVNKANADAKNDLPKITLGHLQEELELEQISDLVALIFSAGKVVSRPT